MLIIDQDCTGCKPRIWEKVVLHCYTPHKDIPVCFTFISSSHLAHVISPRPRGYKTFFMLNSAAHEILDAQKYKYIKKFIYFQAQISLKCYLFQLIYVKMPTIVGILTFMSRKYFMLNELSMELFYNLGARIR